MDNNLFKEILLFLAFSPSFRSLLNTSALINPHVTVCRGS